MATEPNDQQYAPLSDIRNEFSVYAEMESYESQLDDSAETAHNSESLLSGSYNEEESSESFQQALRAWRGVKVETTKAQSVNIPASNHSQSPPAATPTPHDGPSLLDGSYDEEKSHQEFEKALCAWRYGRKPASSRAASPVAPVVAAAAVPEIKFTKALSYFDQLMLDSFRNDLNHVDADEFAD